MFRNLWKKLVTNFISPINLHHLGFDVIVSKFDSCLFCCDFS